MTTRQPDWSERLINAVETAKVLPFRYGLHDCCTFAAHCVDAMCGSGLMSRMQRDHPYSDEEGATARIAEAGGFAALVSEYLGAPMDNPNFASPGDVVLAEDGEGKQVVAVIVGHNAIAPTTGGLVALPYGQIRMAWKV